MTKQIFWLIACLIGIEPSMALDPDSVDAIDSNKASLKVPGKDARVGSDASLPAEPESELDKALNFDAAADPISIMGTPAPVGRSVVPSGVSLTEFLEFGMVPVEDLEAELAAAPKTPGVIPSGPKGRYYTIYTRAVSTGSSGADSVSAEVGDVSEEESDDEDEEEDDDEDPENADL